MNVITNWLDKHFDRVEPREFYRDIFDNDLQKKGKEHYNDGRYVGVAVEVGKDEEGNKKVLRHTITDDLDKIDEMCSRNNFCLMSPISYVGKTRSSENARVLYAIAVDLDGIRIDESGYAIGLHEMFYQIEKINRLPKPTYIVSSGTGIHLYYVLEEPLLLYPNVVEELQKFKHDFTDLIWHGYITELESNVQQESLFQGFRVPGTITKKGERAIAFRVDEGEKVTIEHLNKYVREEFRVNLIKKKSSMSLLEAKEKYPEWYDKRVVQKRPRGTWTCHRGLYDWWLNKIKTERKVGHRYYCLMCLSVYAKKAGIEYDELEKDAFSLIDVMDSISDEETNRFTEGDVLDSLQAYDDKYMTLPINSISYLTDIPIEKNKRNYRKREQHLIMARAMKVVKKSIGEEVNEGRPKGSGIKRDIIKTWREEHPNETKAECHRQTKIDPKTIRKWWDWKEEKVVEVIQELPARKEEPKRQEIREEPSFDANAYLERINANTRKAKRITLEDEMRLAEQREKEKRYEEEADEPIFNFRGWKK